MIRGAEVATPAATNAAGCALASVVYRGSPSVPRSARHSRILTFSASRRLSARLAVGRRRDQKAKRVTNPTGSDLHGEAARRAAGQGSPGMTIRQESRIAQQSRPQGAGQGGPA